MEAKPLEFMSQSEAAKFIGKNRCTLRDWDRTGKLRPGRIAGRPVYLRAELLRLAQCQTVLQAKR